MTFLKGQNYRNKEHSSGSQGSGRVGTGGQYCVYERATGGILVVLKVFLILTSGLANKLVLSFFPPISCTQLPLMSFKTIFVRLYCDSGHISMHLKKLTKLVHFCVTILILKVEENKQPFWHIILYYFKQLKLKKKKIRAV